MGYKLQKLLSECSGGWEHPRWGLVELQGARHYLRALHPQTPPLLECKSAAGGKETGGVGFLESPSEHWPA